MRNPDRLNDFYDKLKELHKNNFPDWRFMQLILNFIRWQYEKYGDDGFYLEEKRFLERFEDFLKEV